jgi:hypothetical protein
VTVKGAIVTPQGYTARMGRRTIKRKAVPKGPSLFFKIALILGVLIVGLLFVQVLRHPQATK